MTKAKRLFKKLCAVTLSVLLILTYGIGSVFADDGTQKAGDAKAQEVAASLVELDRQLQEIGLNLEDFKNLPYKDDAFYQDVQDYLNENMDMSWMTPSTYSANAASTSDGLSEKQIAAFAYGRTAAQWSVQKDGRGLDVNREAVFMVLSHFIDLPTGMSVSPEQAPSMAEGGYLCKYITDHDRKAYDYYLDHISQADIVTGTISTVTALGQLADGTLSFIDNLKDKAISVTGKVLNGVSTGVNYKIEKNNYEELLSLYKTNAESIDTAEELFSLLENSMTTKPLEKQAKDFLASFVFEILATMCCSTGVVGLMVSAGIGMVMFVGQQLNLLYDFIQFVNLNNSRNARLGWRLYRYLGWTNKIPDAGYEP